MAAAVTLLMASHALVPLAPGLRPAPPMRAGRAAMCEGPDNDVAAAPAADFAGEPAKSSLLPRVKVGSSPMMNTEQKKLPGFYIAGGLAVLGLLLGGPMEGVVGEAFGGIREAGGWGDYLGINPPGLAEVRAAKKAAREEAAAARQARAPAASPAPAARVFP